VAVKESVVLVVKNFVVKVVLVQKEEKKQANVLVNVLRVQHIFEREEKRRKDVEEKRIKDVENQENQENN